MQTITTITAVVITAMLIASRYCKEKSYRMYGSGRINEIHEWMKWSTGIAITASVVFIAYLFYFLYTLS